MKFFRMEGRLSSMMCTHLVRVAAMLLLAALAICPAANSQQEQTPSPRGVYSQTNQPTEQDFQVAPLSDLALENLNYVAATAPQIETVLRKDPGLLVELEHWVARDATDHGQMVDEHEMSQDGIFDRLERDLKFRAVATRILQRYGYLQPEINPKSSMGQRQKLEIMAETKRLQEAPSPQESYPSSYTGQGQGYGQGYSYPQNSQGPATWPRTPGYRRNQTRPSFPQSPGLAPTEPQSPWINPSPRQPLNLQQTEQKLNPQSFSGLASSANGTYGSGKLRLQNQPGLNNLSGAGGSFGSGQGTSGMMAAAGYPSFSSLSLEGNASRAQMEQRLREQGLESPSPPEGTMPRPWQYSPYYGQTGESYQQESPRPPIVHRPNPYSSIPSLYDLYEQVSPHSPELQRFGMDIFENPPSDTTELPMDLPAGPNYVVGPGDGLEVNLWGSVTERMYRVVDREGRLTLPEVGPVMVSGENMGEVQQKVQSVLRTQFRDISADVSLARLRTVRVYVVGEVQYPGAYDISSLSTPLNALLAAGGPSKDGSLRLVQHYRGKTLVQNVDLYDLLLHGVRSGLERLENGDTILVPPVGPEVKVEGMVRRPAIYELHGEKTLAQVLQLAGGILPTAALRHIEVQRVVAHEKRTMLSLDIHHPTGSQAVNQQLQAFDIHDGDVIRIFPIAPYNQDAVYLEGHVLRPGRYSFHPGMRLDNLVSSYSDLLPEPAMSYAEIIRLNPPDYHPSVESFDLASALAHPKDSPRLQPLDTVRIFSRFDFHNAPTVTVDGEVRNPGTYRTSGVVRVRDAIYQAGGVTPGASLRTAQLVRSLPGGKLEVMSLNLQEALAGDPLENVPLHPLDRILVQPNPQKSDPASVYVEGAVVRPGRFPLTGNLRISDLVGMAGGLKRSADTRSAELTSYNLEGPNPKIGEHRRVDLTDALKGKPHQDLPLRDGDVLTIKNIPGWDDMGASVTLRGEVKHPGTYGIAPGERLSSVLKRAGGFTAQAYPYGALLERREVRRIQMRSYRDLLARVQQSQESLQMKMTTVNDPDQKLALESGYQQWHTTLQALANNPPLGRVVIHITTDIHRWARSTEDIQVRAGDVLIIPKKPSYVMVQGQVYNPTAASYQPGRSAKWYLRQGGGPTNLANKKAIFVIRADGSVIGAQHGLSLWSGNPLDATLYPGDTVVVPEKPVVGPPQWKSIFQSAQVISSIVTSAVLVAHYY